MSPLKALLCTDVLNDVIAAPFLVSFSQLPAVKNTPKTVQLCPICKNVSPQFRVFATFHIKRGETQVKLTVSQTILLSRLKLEES